MLPEDKRLKLCLLVLPTLHIYRKHIKSCETIVQEHQGANNNVEEALRWCHRKGREWRTSRCSDKDGYLRVVG